MSHTRVHSGDQMLPPRGHFTCTKMTERRWKRVQLSNKIFRKYDKNWETLLAYLPHKRIRGDGKVGGPSSYHTLLSAPLAHWAIITSCSEKLCVLFCLLLSHFMLLLFSYSIGMLPFSLHQSPLSALSVFIHVTHHMSVLDRLKHSCAHDRRNFFPSTLVRENLSNFVKNLQTSSCFYQSSNHGLTQSSRQVFYYLAVTKWQWPAPGCIFVAEFQKFRWTYRI